MPFPEWVRIVREPGAPPIDTTAIKSPADAAAIVRQRSQSEENECGYVLLLDCQNHLIHAQEVSRGTVNSSIITPRDVFRLAIRYNAIGIIVAHNHPSGNPTPSADDKKVSAQLLEAGRVLDIVLYDHLIVTQDRYFSFQEAGLM